MEAYIDWYSKEMELMLSNLLKKYRMNILWIRRLDDYSVDVQLNNWFFNIMSLDDFIKEVEKVWSELRLYKKDTPEWKEYHKQYLKEYNKIPYVIETKKESEKKRGIKRRKDPKYKKYMKEYLEKYRKKKRVWCWYTEPKRNKRE